MTWRGTPAHAAPAHAALVHEQPGAQPGSRRRDLGATSCDRRSGQTGGQPRARPACLPGPLAELAELAFIRKKNLLVFQILRT